MKYYLPLAVLALAVGFAVPHRAEAASNYQLQCTYEVQVEYWYWDSDYYYWKTVYSSNSQAEAQFVYDLLLFAKQEGKLNSFVPHDNWKFFPLDVRLKPKCTYIYVGPEPAYELEFRGY